jgi:hypothetical protein
MAENLRQGPATFAIEADQAVASAAMPQQATAPNVQAAPIAPGISAGAPGVSDVGAKTFKAITDLASGVLAPKIKEAAQEQFVAGVQKAMTGEALGEIIKDQPWYTDIFAPSSALAGARAYTSQQAIASWAGKMQDAMPKLAQASPEDLRGAAVAALQGFMTGDAAADSAITAGVVEHMAPLFKQHAKSHYIYVQKQASLAQIGAIEAGSKVYQGFAEAEARGDGTVSHEDVTAAAQRLLANAMPFADQSDESYDRNIRSVLLGAAGSGNFQVVKLFKDSGLYDKISPDHRAELDRSLSSFARKALDKVIPQFAVEMATLVNDATQNPKDIPAKVQALNAKAARLTGVTEADLIPLSQLDNIVGSVMKEQRAADAAALKQVPAPDTGVAIAASFITQGPGALDNALKTGLVKDHDAEAAGLQAWLSAKSPTEKAAILNSRTVSGFSTIKSEFVQTMRAEEFHQGVGQMAQVYATLADNVKPHYFDEHERALMDRFNAQVRAGTPPDAAWAVGKVNASLQNFMLPDSLKDEASKAIRSVVESHNENLFGINSVDAAGLRMAEAVTKKAYASDRSNNPPNVAAERAWSQAVANGLNPQGKHMVLNARPSDPPLFVVVGEGQKATAAAFEKLMAEKAKHYGADLDNYTAIRVPDHGKQAYIQVEATDKDGKTFSWAITSQELKAAAVEHAKYERLAIEQPMRAFSAITDKYGAPLPVKP